MAKDPTQTFSAGKFGNVWLATVGATEPADFSEPFDTDDWFNVGYLEDAPDPQRAISKTDILPWNAPEAIAQILDTDSNTFTIKPMQVNRTSFELYFGAVTFTPEGTGGVRIEPDDTAAEVEKFFCLELLDGDKVFRIYWKRCSVESVGTLSMPRDGLISFELTLRRLQAVSGANWFHQTNLLSLVSA